MGGIVAHEEHIWAGEVSVFQKFQCAVCSPFALMEFVRQMVRGGGTGIIVGTAAVISARFF